MKPSEEVELLEHLHLALSCPIGIVLKTNDPKRLQASLRKARSDAVGDTPELAGLLFRLNPLDQEGELWIIKGGEERADSQQTDSTNAPSR